MKTIGIVAHSAEGAALCFLTACREGSARLTSFMHPDIILSAIPMALSMPDNTAHIVLEQIAPTTPIPGLHIADVVCDRITASGFTRVGLLGTRWTMTGPVYEAALARRGLERLIPHEPARQGLSRAIFDELCRGVFRDATTRLFLNSIGDLKARGAQCVILGCTEIPLIVTPENSPLPVLDSTRLLAGAAVDVAIAVTPLEHHAGWLRRTPPPAKALEPRAAGW